MNWCQRIITWLAKGFIKFIALLPATNFRTFVGVMSSITYVTVVLVGIVNGRVTDDNLYVVSSVGIFLLAQMGLDVKQFIEKRRTFQPAPPKSPDAEDLPAQETSP